LKVHGDGVVDDAAALQASSPIRPIRNPVQPVLHLGDASAKTAVPDRDLDPPGKPLLRFRDHQRELATIPGCS